MRSAPGKVLVILITMAFLCSCSVFSATEETETAAGAEKEENTVVYAEKIPQTVSVHDPSIFLDRDGKYYIVGTHITSAESDDLFNWTQTDESFRNALSSETMSSIREYNDDFSAGSPVGYLWAPDMIYNEAMQKYCIYLSANGDHWQSNIVLLTGDSVTGPFEYAGSVVYGGFTADNWTQTDVAQALMLDPGSDTLPDRYILNGVANDHWGDKFPNCIDPCVFYDQDGTLWMSYGSWSGGIFLLKLDENTGLRDYSVTYPLEKHSDPYFGTLIAGGSYVTGEGSYIHYMNGYYWLFISYGMLESNGGYNIRVFRSEAPEGPYMDKRGNTPFFDSYVMNYNFPTGERLFGAYKWNTADIGLVAQGHNSAFTDNDGKSYIVFHTRTTNGTEYHYVRIHQLFFNEEGWLVAAPYRTCGETLPENGLGASAIAGEYDFILHRLDIDYASKETALPESVTLNEDGTITGAFTGTWETVEGSAFITLNIESEHDKESDSYKGVALEMTVDDLDVTTVVFTVLGSHNQLTMWGSRRI